MSVNWEGGWVGVTSSSISYYTGDIINHNNIVYTVKKSVAIVPIGSPSPDLDMSNWDVFASGSNGTSGSSGNSGTSGDAGTSGSSGNSGTSGSSGNSGTNGSSGSSGTTPANIVNIASGLANAGTFVTLDNIKATVTTAGNRGLSLATVSGTFSCNIGGNFNSVGAGNGGYAGVFTITTTASSSIFGWGFNNQSDTSTYILTDTTNSRAYRITLQIGYLYNNNFISIERLI